MKFLTQQWPDEHAGYLYFFQRLEEMLFHYSSDIVRAPIHNTRTLINEYLYNEAEMKQSRVKGYQLDQILSELRESVKNDKILSKNLGRDFVELVVKDLHSQRGDLVKYLRNKVPGKTYFEWTREYLIEHCATASHKDAIEYGLRAWIVEILSRGHSPEYVYKYLQAEMGATCIDAVQKFNAFIDHFLLEPQAFRVYFTFSNTLSECKRIFERRLKVIFDDDGAFGRVKLPNKYFMGYIDVNSLDRYTAVNEAFSMIKTYLKYYRVISNRKKELVRKFCMIQEMGRQEFYTLPVQSLGYRSIELEPHTDITAMVDGTILACQEKPKKTKIQLNKTIDLHNQAIRQHDLNDGFVNLWSILEIVCEDTLGDSKIEKVINGIAPILQKDYFSVLHENIGEDLRDNLSKQDFKSLIEQMLDNDPDIDPIAQFIYLPQFEQLREEYFKKLCGFPIIMTKIHRLYKLKGNISDLKALSVSYAQRVKWHIYRLYRTRNAIVHAGDTHQRIQMLGEHLHIYVDRIMYEILIKLATEKSLQTITDVLIDTKLSSQKSLEILSQKKPVSEEIIMAMHESFFYQSKDKDMAN